MKNKPISPWLWYITVIPFVYLLATYGDLPANIPIHYNTRGEADRWGHKAILWIFPILVVLVMLLMARLVPQLDRDGKLAQMGKKYEWLSIVIVGAIAAIMTYFIHQAGNEQLKGLNGLLIIFGLLYSFLGNFTINIPPNYFVGFRLPWTLKYEGVWRITHRFSGQLWFWSGLVIATLSLWVPIEWTIPVLLGITIIICLIPTIYSWRAYRKMIDGDMI
ncbi:MAG: SdpI family protein [Bacteroidota bacterium]